MARKYKYSDGTHYLREGKTVTIARGGGKEGGRMPVTVKTFPTAREAKAFINQAS